MQCSVCKVELPRDGDYVCCGRCKNGLHYQCSGLQKNTWKGKTQKKKEDWQCANCRSSGRTLSQGAEEDESEDLSYNAIKSLLESMFAKQEKIITERMENMTAVLTELEGRMDNVMDKVLKLEEEGKDLRRELEDLKLNMELEKQYGRSKNIIITSIPEHKEEDLYKTVTDMLKKMNISINRSEFTAHRLPSKNKPANIILQCSTRATRDTIVNNARKMKPKVSTLGLGGGEVDRSVFFNDHLTPYFVGLMGKARQLKISKGYRFLWLNGNKIMMRKNEQSKAIKIIKESDLDNVK